MDEAKEALTSFLKAWKMSDWDVMYLNCQKTWMHRRFPTDIKMELQDKIPLKYRIKRITAINDVVCDADIYLHYVDIVMRLNVRLIKEIDAFKPTIDGKWGINPKSLKRYA